MSQNSKLGEFEEYLEGKSDLSQLYAGQPQVELPAHLDAAILAEAHRAVNARPGAKPKRRWTIPLSMVASVAVAVMIGLQLPYMLKDAAPPQRQMEEKIAVAALDKSAAEASAPAPYESRKTQEMARVMAKPTSRFAAGEPAPVSVEAEAPAPAFAASGEITTAATERLGAVSVFAPPAPAASAQASAASAKRLRLGERADIGSGLARSEEKEVSAHAGGDVSDALEQPAPAAAPMATAPQPVRATDALNSPLKADTGAASLRPADWLIRIQGLKQAGRLEEAEKELAAFKKRYTAYPVPKALEVQ